MDGRVPSGIDTDDAVAENRSKAPLFLAWTVSLAILAGIVAFVQFTAPSARGPGKEGRRLSIIESPSTRAEPLHPVEKELLEDSRYGLLPKKDDTRAPWQVYAHPWRADPNVPQIAIVVSGLGLSEQVTDTAVRTLDSRITLAYSPYAQKLKPQVELARAQGHEILAVVPMEPSDYPRTDPGPLALMSTDKPGDIVNHLHAILAGTPGAIGVLGSQGSRLTTLKDPMSVMMGELSRRGLAYVDARTTPFSLGPGIARDLGVPRAYNDGFVDEALEPGAIARQLEALELRAKATGYAVGIAQPYPLTYEILRKWTDGLATKGIALVPVSALMNRQAIR